MQGKSPCKITVRKKGQCMKVVITGRELNVFDEVKELIEKKLT